uniref:Uncharacterized protein n=1 Tax=Romanomermis culicivorax TaxID=13658 RepID=A0A915JDY9_ROMCU
MADSMVGVQGLLERFVLDQKERDIRVSMTTDRPLQTQDMCRTLPTTSATCIANDQRLRQMEADESEQKFTVKPAVKSKVSTEKWVTERLAVREQATSEEYQMELLDQREKYETWHDLAEDVHKIDKRNTAAYKKRGTPESPIVINEVTMGEGQAEVAYVDYNIKRLVRVGEIEQWFAGAMDYNIKLLVHIGEIEQWFARTMGYWLQQPTEPERV